MSTQHATLYKKIKKSLTIKKKKTYFNRTLHYEYFKKFV